MNHPETLKRREIEILRQCRVGKTTGNLRRATKLIGNTAYTYMLEKLAREGLILYSEGQWRTTEKGKKTLAEAEA